MTVLEKVISKKIKALEEKNILRETKLSNRLDGINVLQGKKKLISFCCNDYLGLSQNKKVIKAGMDAIKEYGVGSGSSRLVTGNNPLYEKLETILAKKKNTEAACVFGSGYLANIGTIPSIAGRGDLVVADKLAHSCINDGMKLSGATFKRYSHNSLNSLENILKNNRKMYNNCLIVTETVFSMDGDRAPLKEINKIAKKYDSWVMTDDAHGFGIVDVDKTDIQMGTLSKAVGCYGGYVCGSKKMIGYIKNSAKSLIYSTALPPSVLASSNESIRQMNKDLCSLPLKKARLFTSILGIKEAESAIVPLIIGSEEDVLKASEKLRKEGFLVAAIRPPTVPKGTSRLRFTFSALHKDADIKKLAGIIKQKGWV